MTSNESYWMRSAGGRVSRRNVLRGAGLAGAGLVGAALVGCGDDDGAVTPAPTPTSTSGTVPPEGQPPRQVSSSEFAQMPLEEMREVLGPSGLRYLPGQLEAMQNGPVTGGTLNYAKNAPTTYDFLSVQATQIAVNPGSHNSLLTFHMDGDFGPHGDFEVEADLPESYEYADDTTLIFHLRDQPVYWHDIAPVDGREMTVEDIRMGVEALKAAPIQGPAYRDVGSIETPDDKTVVLHFDRPAAYFLRASCTPYQFLAPPEQLDAGTLSDWLIGTGAFQLAWSQRDEGLGYERNPRYFKTDPIYGTGQQLPFLDKIEGVHLPDLASNHAAWGAGRIDYAYAVNISRQDIVERLRDRADAVTVIVPPPPSFFPFIVVNTQTPPFTDERVRRAMSMALDREGINEGIAGGVAAPCYGQDWTFFDRPDNPWPWTEEELGPYYPYNPSEAKQLLQAAGFDDGLGRAVELAFGTSDTGTNAAVWLAMADLWRTELGVDISIDMAPDAAAYNQKLRGAEYQDLMAATPLPAWDPDDFAYGQLHSQSTANYFTVNDSILDELTERQQTVFDLEERRQILREIMDRDLDQMYRFWGIDYYKFTVRSPELFNVSDHYLAWMTPGWGERKLELAWKRA